MYAVIHAPAHENALATCGFFFSPYVEIAGEAIAFNIRGLQILYPQGDEEIISAITQKLLEHEIEDYSLIIGENLALSFLVAPLARGTHFLKDLLPQIDNLPLESLNLDENLRELFLLWGITRIGELTKLPLDSLVARIGSGIVDFTNTIEGESLRPFQPRSLEEIYRWDFQFDNEIQNIENCIFLIGRGLQQLCKKLASHANAACKAQILFALSNSEKLDVTINIPFPSANYSFWLKLFQHRLHKTIFTAPMNGFSIELFPTQRRTIQLDLFQPPTPEPGNLELLLEKIRSYVGRENVGVPALLDSHHPRAFVIDGESRPLQRLDSYENPRALPFCYRRFAKPLPVSLLWSHEEKRPHAILFPDHKKHFVALAQGPWKLSGEWWETNWNFEEWDLTLNGGEMLRVSTQNYTRWFLEGYYD